MDEPIAMDEPTTDLHATLTRLLSTAHRQNLPGTKRASIALILRPSNPSPPPFTPTSPSLDLLFIQRATRASDPWSSHIAFPGGRRDASDATDLSTAIRETREELNLDLSDPTSYRLVSRLRDLRIRRGGRTSHAILCAFVFLQLPRARNDHPTPQPAEVAAAFWTPLRVLHGVTARREHFLNLPPASGFFWRVVRGAFGLQGLRMAAVDVLPHAKDRMCADGEAGCAPHALLWGISLAYAGDVVQALGRRRADWPAALPENAWVAGVVAGVADVVWWVWDRVKGRTVDQRRITLE